MLELTVTANRRAAVHQVVMLPSEYRTLFLSPVFSQRRERKTTEKCNIRSCSLALYIVRRYIGCVIPKILTAC